MANKFDKKKQLQKLIQRYRDDPIDIDGIIIDYIGSAYVGLDKVFKLNYQIYEDLFVNGDKKLALNLLRSILKINSELVSDLEASKKSYPVVFELLNNIYNDEDEAPPEEVDFSLLHEVVGFNSNCIIWQISDIHFGKYNQLENDPRELAALLGKTASEYPELKPNLIIISGDLTSIAHEDEFRLFTVFCEYLKEFMWNDGSPHRLIVVPGNHDTSWQEDGSTDKFNKFIDIVVNNKCCITPFGLEHENFSESTVEVNRYYGNNESVSPFAVVEYHDFDFEIVLLNSAYFSGIVPKHIIKLIDSAQPLSDKLTDLLREDKGAVSLEYCFNITKQLKETAKTRIAVSHHNLCTFGSVVCVNEYAPLLLETLFKKNIGLVLHGHVHLEEDNRSRGIQSGHSYPIPCQTLSSDALFGSRGLNIHLLGPKTENRDFATLVWPLTTYPSFIIDDLKNRYHFKLNPEHIRKI